MKQTIRYPLLIGLIISLIEFFIFSLGHFATLKTNFNFIVLIMFLLTFTTLIFILKSFKTYNMTTENLKKHRKTNWITCILISIYWFYLLVIIILKKYTSFVMNLSHLIILGGAILLIIMGNSMRILEKSLQYESKEMLNPEKN